MAKRRAEETTVQKNTKKIAQRGLYCTAWKEGGKGPTDSVHARTAVSLHGPAWSHMPHGPSCSTAPMPHGPAWSHMPHGPTWPHTPCPMAPPLAHRSNAKCHRCFFSLSESRQKYGLIHEGSLTGFDTLYLAQNLQSINSLPLALFVVLRYVSACYLSFFFLCFTFISFPVSFPACSDFCSGASPLQSNISIT